MIINNGFNISTVRMNNELKLCIVKCGMIDNDPEPPKQIIMAWPMDLDHYYDPVEIEYEDIVDIVRGSL